MSDLIAIYDKMVVAILGDDDETAKTVFHPDFVVHEDPGMPYGGVFSGPDGFLGLRHHVHTYWDADILSKCVSPENDRLIIFLRMRGLPEGPLAGMETYVTVVWTYRDGKAQEARVLYYDTPRLAAAMNEG